MSYIVDIHPENPQPRLIKQAVSQLQKGAVIAYPTDSSYALGCHIGDKAAQERIRRIRQVDDKHNFTLVCRDLSEISLYARVDNSVYRMLKALTPGPYTFILRATSEVPRRLQTPKRKTIGLRVPDNIICQALLAELNEPIMSSTLILPGEEMPLNEPQEIEERLGKHVDMIIDGGSCSLEPTTVVELYEGHPLVAREGRGDISVFED